MRRYTYLTGMLLCSSIACGPEPVIQTPVIMIPDLGQAPQDMPTPDDASADSDLPDLTPSLSCGNGELDEGELCDGDCPPDALACDDGDLCTQDVFVGSPDTCDARCEAVPIVACESGDGCCAPGCLATQDTDCERGPGESCLTPDDCGPSSLCLASTGGYCVTETGCMPGESCDAGQGTCIDVGNNETGCVPGCETDADCRVDEGYTCDEIGTTSDRFCRPGPVMGNGMSGIACTTQSDCGDDPTENCLEEETSPDFVNGYCVTGIGCEPGSCGGDDVCVSTTTSRACYDGCVQDSDCRPEYECLDIISQPGAVCYPRPNNLRGSTGEPCSSDDECTTVEFCANEGGLYEGGYCTRYCQFQSQCPLGSTCHFSEDSPRLGLCMSDCSTDADCRGDRYTCIDRHDQNARGCFPIADGERSIGGECDELADCNGAFALCYQTVLFPGGYCSALCSSDADCGAGSHCGVEGACLESCSEDTECRDENYTCGDRDDDMKLDCLLGGSSLSAQIGDACLEVGECSGGIRARCLNDASSFKDGYCSQTCNASTPCPTGSHCGYVNSNGSGLCVKDCQDDSTCRDDGYQCWNIDDDRAGVMECAPSGTGSGGAGDACQSASDCRGGTQTRCSRASAGGFCIMFCETDADCGGQEHCGFINSSTGEGVCASDCTTDAECRTDEEYHCFNADNDLAGVKECYISGRGSGELGAPCKDVTQCQGGRQAECLRGRPELPLQNGYCSQFCDDDQDCGQGNACINTLCYDGCSNLYDCRNSENYVCTQFQGINTPVCYPPQ